MKKFVFGVTTVCIVLTGLILNAQDLKSSAVPAIVKTALLKKHPTAVKVSWEKEKGNYEANWGGKSGEDLSVVFSPDGVFVEQVQAIAVSSLPVGVAKYVAAKYKATKIAEAGKVTDATGKIMYEAEVKGKDLLFNEKGSFIKID